MGTGGKERPGRDADHSPSSSTEVKKEGGYTSSPPKHLSWRVAGQLYFTLSPPERLFDPSEFFSTGSEGCQRTVKDSWSVKLTTHFSFVLSSMTFSASWVVLSDTYIYALLSK
jgi:hypothetical protein